MSDHSSSGKEQEVTDDFVQKEAVPVDEAESFVHIGLDDAYHPTGGYWFPSGKKWGDASGWVSSKDDIPIGELIQYPCDDRDPEIRGRLSGELPDWVVNRVVPKEADRNV